MRIPSSRQRSRRDSSGMTLTETLIGSTVGSLVLAGLIPLVWLVGVEQRQTTADALLQQRVNRTQDRLIAIVRSMSATESVIFGDPVTKAGGFTVYQRIIVAKGKAPDFPREQIYYSPASRALIHDPDRNVAGDESHIYDSDGLATIKDFYFYPSMKPGGILDGSTLNVWLEFDDQGSAGRSNPDGSRKYTTVVRTFAVRFRN
jgi:hypothetical protein